MSSSEYLHSNHLHVTTLELARQLLLVGVHHLDILLFETELPSTGMFAESSSLDDLLLAMMLLERKAFATCTHVCGEEAELAMKMRLRGYHRKLSDIYIAAIARLSFLSVRRGD
jgi:hypothetical protein